MSLLISVLASRALESISIKGSIGVEWTEIVPARKVLFKVGSKWTSGLVELIWN